MIVIEEESESKFFSFMFLCADLGTLEMKRKKKSKKLATPNLEISVLDYLPPN